MRLRGIPLRCARLRGFHRRRPLGVIGPGGCRSDQARTQDQAAQCALIAASASDRDVNRQARYGPEMASDLLGVCHGFSLSRSRRRWSAPCGAARITTRRGRHADRHPRVWNNRPGSVQRRRSETGRGISAAGVFLMLRSHRWTPRSCASPTAVAKSAASGTIARPERVAKR